MIEFSLAPNLSGVKMIHPDHPEQEFVFLPLNTFEIAKTEKILSGTKKPVITLNPNNWNSIAPKYTVDPTKTNNIVGLPDHNGDIDILIGQLQDLLQSFPAGGVLGPGFATEATLLSIGALLGGVVRSVSASSTVVPGTIVSGAQSIFIFNAGFVSTGTVLGIDLPPRISRSFAAEGADLLGAIAYDPTPGAGTIFEIHEIR